MTTETLPATTAPVPATRRRRPRCQYPKKVQQLAEAVEKKLPEYLEAHEVQAIIKAAEDPRARLLIMEQWRAGLRVSEALALEVADLSLDAELPTLRERQGKGRKSRIVPVHPELGAAFQVALSFGNVSEGRIIDVHRSTAWRWVQRAHARAEQLGAVPPGREIGNHTLRHSYARHLLMNGISINYLSRWLGHSSIQTTLIYLELVPDPTGSLSIVP
ncbi:MAG: tyrosine-type recombinase/integrase [Chloroflexi bacterium]|nr:tyrosine-type recombinase/integrase [Chloroflexota bacterium]